MISSHSRIVKTIHRTLPAVVSIVIKKPLEELQKEMSGMGHGKKKVQDFDIPAEKIDARGMVQVDGGSGFFVDPSGVILTNKHVVAEPGSTYTAITNEGEEYPVVLLARDPINDIAILKIENAKRNFPFLPLGNSLAVQLGEPVLTFGNALGIFQNTVSLGIISGLSRSITAKTDEKNFQEMRGLIQTDAAINPGNSGGPLTDARGRVIGINTAIIAGAQNICFAIPIHTAKKDLEELHKYGRIRRPMLGIHYLLIHKDLMEKRGLPIEYGAIVERQYPFERAIHPKGPADKAGIKERDIIIEWNGKRITFEKSILDYLENSEVGEKVEFTILRDGKKIKISVVLGERK